MRESPAKRVDFLDFLMFNFDLFMESGIARLCDESNNRVGNIMCDKNEERRFELQSQLHEQYAQNFNSHVGVFVSILGVIFIVITAFGYVYAHTDTSLWDSYISEGNCYSMHHFLVLTVMVSGILYFLSYLCSMFSYIERRDQVINMHIRDLYQVKTGYEDPTNLKKNEFMPEFYKAFFVMVLVSQGVVLLLVLNKIIQSAFSNWILLLVFPILLFVLSIKSRCDFYKKFKKYKKDLTE